MGRKTKNGMRKLSRKKYLKVCRCIVKKVSLFSIGKISSTLYVVGRKDVFGSVSYAREKENQSTIHCYARPLTLMYKVKIERMISLVI